MRCYFIFFIFLPVSLSLRCFKCSASSQNSSCYEKPPLHGSQDCDSPHCQVWKLYSEITGQIYMFERGCSWTCARGCIILADMENRFVSCSSCCETDNCNDDNIASVTYASKVLGAPAILTSCVRLFVHSIF